MAETIVNFVLGKLADVEVQEVLHLYGVNEQIEEVSRELGRIQVFLKDADRKIITYECQKDWVKEVTNIAHSIEDVIDTFLIENPQNSQKSGMWGTIKNMLRKTKELQKNEMNQIQKKMKEIEMHRVEYEINNLGEVSGDIIRLPVRPFVLSCIDPDIVGFKADQDCILKELLDETTKRRSVVSICGTGGLGKTTLALKVYNCGDVKKQFEVRIWVTISQNFEVIDVSRKIKRHLNLERTNKTEVILTEIHKSLRGKKYLIVLDDVWITNLWTQIGAAFPDENNGSRVLMTTRFAHVCKSADPICEPYKIQFLTEEFSEIIDTSYENLPFSLRSCFMYFAAFPEDYVIHATSLFRLWIAEGFILQEDNRTLEEIAESFLEDLVQRSMVQVKSRSYDGSINDIRIHILLQDLAIQKAKEDNFLLVYSQPEDEMSLSSARRVAIHNPDCEQLTLSKNLRTLLCFHSGRMPNCSRQRMLKVVSFGQYMENIIELRMFEGLNLLRYLSLRGTLSDEGDQEFFEKVVISRMKFLRTLKVQMLKTINGQYFELPKRTLWL